MGNFIKILIFIFCLSGTIKAQKNFNFDTSMLVCKSVSVFDSRNILIDTSNNKFIFSEFKGNTYIDTNLLTTISVSPYFQSIGLFVAKFDENNKILKAKKLIEGDTIVSYIAKQDNKYIYIGVLYIGKIYFENDSIISKGNTDILIIRYTKNLEYVNKIEIGNYNGESLSKSTILSDVNNNIYITGSFNGAWGNNFPNYELIIGNDTLFANNLDIFVAKYDSVLTPVWAKSFGGNGSDGITNLYLSDNTLYICGILYNAGPINNIGGINVSYPLNYNSTCFLAKLDTNGNAIWVRRFGSKYNNALGNVSPRDLVIKNDKIYFTAYGNDQNQLEFFFDGGPNLLGIAGASTFESFVACYDTAGNFKWRKLVPDVTYPSQLTVDSNSNVIGIGGNDFTLKVFSYDSTGAFNWQAVSDADNLCTTVGSGITQDTHGKLYIVGGTTCNPLYMGNDTLHPPVGQSTLFYASLDSINAQWADNTQDINPSSNSIRIYPNPAYNLLTLENIDANVATKTITISNLQAQVVYKTTTTENKININTSTLPNGVYSIQYKTNKEFVTQKIIIQH